jgi:hypothetical protein
MRLVVVASAATIGKARALIGHPAQPDHPGGGGLAAAAHRGEQVRALLVERVHQVAAVVDHQVRAGRPGVERAVDVLVVAEPVHPGAGEHGRRATGGERGRDVVLGGQRVGGGQEDTRPARPQRVHQPRGLGRDVQAGRDGEPGERPLRAEPPGEQAQHRHAPLRPLDPGPPGFGQARIGDVGERKPAVPVGAGGHDQ